MDWPTGMPNFGQFGNLIGNPAINNPSGLVSALYQDYLGRAPDPGGLQTFTSALQGLDPASSAYQTDMTQIAQDLFQSPEGQKYAATNPWSPQSQPTSLIPSIPMSATPQAMAAASTPGGPAVDATTGQPVGQPPAAPTAPPSGTGAPATGAGGGGGFDLANSLQSLMQFAPGGAQSPTPQTAPISDWMKTMSQYLQPPTPAIPSINFGLGGGQGGGAGGSQAQPFGYNTSAWGGLPPSYAPLTPGGPPSSWPGSLYDRPGRVGTGGQSSPTIGVVPGGF